MLVALFSELCGICMLVALFSELCGILIQVRAAMAILVLHALQRRRPV
jgi:hypothetical protein